MFEVPILFIVFNRPDSTAQVLESIRSIKPSKLYIASDGPRNSKENEIRLVDQVRAIVSEIDWPCAVHKLFRQNNLGCKLAVSSAIEWFFNHEEFGIIIEDDVVPNNTFYHFMGEMLNRYKNDERVMMVTGTNYYSDVKASHGYFFSEHMTIWGWGTWKRAWSLYDVDMRKWSQREYKKYFSDKYLNTYRSRHYSYTFDSLSKGYMDTWDIQWNFCCLINHGLCITPSVNLVTNVGTHGTHGSGETDSHFMKTYEMSSEKYKYYDSDSMMINYDYDIRLHKNKNFKVVIMRDLIKIARFLGIYNILKYPYNFFRCLRF